MQEQKTENSLGLKLNKGTVLGDQKLARTVLVPLAIFVSLPFRCSHADETRLHQRRQRDLLAV